jgi:hypothetical protein
MLTNGRTIGIILFCAARICSVSITVSGVRRYGSGLQESDEDETHFLEQLMVKEGLFGFDIRE